MHRLGCLAVLGLLSLALGCPGGDPEPPASAWADLHAHPMAHVAMGHSPRSDTCDKDIGLFHGRPGERFDPADPNATILDDLGACDIGDHAHCPSHDAVKEAQRASLLSLFEDAHEDHTTSGAPDFGSWPSPNSRIHQQMHLKWLHRAYQGGMRLMIASMTDNELVSKYYNDDLNCTGVFSHDAGFNFDSAMEQIALLKALDEMTDDIGGDALPGDWFDIAYSAGEAQQIYDAGKLVLVLGAELDTLELDQLEALWDEGVRSFIPIHLTDNAFGGTAVYSDVFNALSNWQNGGTAGAYRFYSVVGDPTLATRLTRPSVLSEEVNFGGFLGCSIQPRPLSDAEWDALGYEAMDPRVGQRNALGLTETGVTALTELMARGALVDIAHMSWQATEDALAEAERFGFPVINSHTGLREGAAGDDATERDMTFEHARRVAALGGMIGLGTLGTPKRSLLGLGVGAPVMRFTDEGRAWRTWRERDFADPPGTKVSHLVVRVMTGEDDLRGGDGLALQPSRAWLEITLADGRKASYDLNDSAGWPGGAIRDVTWDLTASDSRASETLGTVDLDQITSYGLRFQSGGGWTDGDTWKVDLFEVAYRGTDASGSPVFAPIVERYGRPFRAMSNVQTAFSLAPGSQRPVDPTLAGTLLDRLDVTATIGADSGGERVDLVVVRRDGRPDIREDFRALAGVVGGWQNSGDTATATLDLAPYALAYGDIAGVYLEGFSDRCCNGDLWQELDIATARASFVEPDGTVHEIADFESEDKRGFPTFRFSAPFSSGVLWQGLADPTTTPTTLHNLGASLTTGQDDLHGGSVATLSVWLRDGSVQDLPLIGGGFGLGGGEAHEFRRLPLSPPVSDADIVAVGVHFVGSGGISPDNWNVDRIRVWAQSDPLRTWVEEVEGVIDALQVGSEAPIAFGTDLNGFELQLPYTDPPVDDLPQSLDALPADFTLPRGDTTGTRTFTLEEHGLAHVGLLPDFVDRIARRASSAVTSALLDSAQRTITTWANAEAAAVGVAATLDAGPPAPDAGPPPGGP